MKNLIKNLGVLLLTLMSTIGAIAQDAPEYQRSYFPARDGGWWTLGINGGWAYQQSDVPSTLDGFGFGMTLGKNMYYRPGGAVSFDWRGRWLYSQTIGLDTKRATGIENNSALNGSRDAGEGLDYTQTPGEGYVFQNHKTQHFELGLEGVLTANRLRERTGVIASLYGGINLDWYNPKLDQANGNGIYDYSGIDHINDSKSSIKSILRTNILDGIYETNAHGFEDDAGKLKFMPSLGIELGYQFTPRFSMHVGHKATFSGTDDLDGELWDNNNSVTAENDIHHYTNLGLQWIIDPREHRMDPPIINVTNPRTNPYVSRTSAGRVDAKIKNVRNRADVTCHVNGRPTSFSFNRGNFRVNFPLEYGNNEVLLTATNEVGSDEETVVIYYGDNSSPPVITDSYAPRVKITTPRNSPTTVENSNYTIQATVEYVQNNRDIEFIVNGQTVSNFNYNNRNDQFSGGINLRAGRNEIEIIARNEVGSDRDNVVIILEERVNRPSVRITSPSRDPYETTQRNVTVTAELQNVTSKRDVQFFVNGRERSLFDYNARNGRFSADLSLADGRNEVTVKGFNESGDAQDQTTIIYRDNTPTVRPPVVRITSPSRNNYETTQASISIQASIQNVNTKNDVRFYVNGRERTLFNYNARNGNFSANINLDNGRNEVLIKGYNEAGNDEDNVTIIYRVNNQPVVRPPVVTITSVSSGAANPFEPNASACRTTIKATIVNVDRKSDITFKLNGRTQSNFSFNTSTKVFESTITLAEGSNQLYIRAVNSAGSDEDQASRDCAGTTAPSNPPEVTINKPSNNSTTTNSTVNLNARVKNVRRKRDVRVKLNGSTFSDFSFSVVSGVVTANIDLANGNNTISVWGKNTDGEDEATIRVNYNAPKTPPTVNITQPSNNATTDTKTATVKAKILNINSKNDIRFTFNGRTSSNFSYSTSSKTFSANVSLSEGNNTITIKATTADGSDSETVRVQYVAPKVLPTVKISLPKNNLTTETATTAVKATTKNVSRKSDVTFFVNGAKVSSFSFSRNNFNANTPLKKGKNTIRIEVKNQDGTAQDEVSINYKPKVVVAPKPVVRFTNPRRSGTTSKKQKVTIEASVENVRRQFQIEVYANGKRLSEFKYDGRKKLVSFPMDLKNGKNTIKIKANNDSGSAEAETALNFKEQINVKENKPIISISSVSTPAANPFNPSVRGSTIIGIINNISDKSQIKITLNGNAVTDFTFNPRNKKFQVSLQLVAGENKVKITATNRAGSDIKEHTY